MPDEVGRGGIPFARPVTIMPANTRKSESDTFMLRVPPPRIVRRDDPQPRGRLIDPQDGPRFDLLQSDLEHALVKSGEVLSLSIPRFKDADVPVAFVLDWLLPEDEPERHEMMEAPYRDNYFMRVRYIGGYLFAPYGMRDRDLPTEIGAKFFAGDVDVLVEVARDMFSDHDLFRSNPFLLNHVAGHLPSKELLDQNAVGRHLYRGLTPSDALLRSAGEDFAIIGDRIHRKVHDPVLGFTARNGEQCLSIMLPIVPDEDALKRFRHDNPVDAEAFFAGGLPRRDDAQPMGRYGRMSDVSPEYVSTRDDARMSALDAGKSMLAATSRFLAFGDQMPARLVREWYVLRDTVELLDADVGHDPLAILDAADTFAQLCTHKTDGLDVRYGPAKIAASSVAKTNKLAARRRNFLPAAAPEVVRP
jgi:hypothetical protein